GSFTQRRRPDHRYAHQPKLRIDRDQLSRCPLERWMAFVIRMLGIHRDHDHRCPCCGDSLRPAEHVLVATRPPPAAELREKTGAFGPIRSLCQCNLLRMAQVEGDMRRRLITCRRRMFQTPENDLLQPRGHALVERTRWSGLAPESIAHACVG